MSRAVHISKKGEGAWAVKRQGAARNSSVHQTQREAIAAGRRLALKSGGAEVVVHRADGRIRNRDTVGAAQIDALKEAESRTTSERQPRRVRKPRKVPRTTTRKAPATSRAPRTEGPRTTLRIPASLAEIADRLAEDLEVSRNDALVRLASRGARQYEQELRISELRDRRWAAVIPGIVDIDQADFPSPEEAREAVLTARDEVSESPG